MFKELLPILRHRAVLMTITSTADDEIRVNVVPKKLKDDENNALTTPLSVTGTADELDAELGTTLVDFVGSHLQLKNTLQQAKADMEAAAKAAQADAKAKQKNGKDEKAAPGIAKPMQQEKLAAPVEPPASRTASLFDMPSPAHVSTTTPAPSPVSLEGSEEDEILDEIIDGDGDDRTEDDTLEDAA